MAKVVKTDDAGIPNTAPALTVLPRKAPVITGNFDEMESYLLRVSKKYKDVDFSSANIIDVMSVKKEMQLLRTSTEKIEKGINDTYFNNPKKIMKGNFARLYALIAEVEVPINEIIALDDQKRIDGINFAIDSYIEEFTKDMPIGQDYLERIERPKHFYNKTQSEVDTRNAVLSQVTALFNEEKAAKASARVIKAACASDARLSEKLFLDMLERGEDVATILEAIEEELVRLTEVTAGNKEEETDTDADTGAGPGDNVLLDALGDVDFDSDLPERTKTVIVEITYPKDAGNALTKLFEMLHAQGIRAKILESK